MTKQAALLLLLLCHGLCGYLIGVTKAAPCGCTARQQQAPSINSLVINATGDTASESHNAGANNKSSDATTSGSAAAKNDSSAASFVRIDDMLIPIDDLLVQKVSDTLGSYRSAQASSSSSSRSSSSTPQPSRYVSCRRLWPNGRVYYRFSGSFPSSYRNLVRQSLARLQASVRAANGNRQLISFIEADYFIDVHYVNVINDDGCYSYVGKTELTGSSKQDLSLSVPGCMLESIIQHEFIHALGFYHEHQRPDRDSFVSVLWNNIESDRCSNFLKHSFLLRSNYPSYDYGSVMHYQSTAFSCRNGLLTMVRLGGGNFSRNSLSSVDVSKLSYTYSTSNLNYCSPSAAAVTKTNLPLTLLLCGAFLLATSQLLTSND